MAQSVHGYLVVDEYFRSGSYVTIVTYIVYIYIYIYNLQGNNKYTLDKFYLTHNCGRAQVIIL